MKTLTTLWTVSPTLAIAIAAIALFAVVGTFAVALATLTARRERSWRAACERKVSQVRFGAYFPAERAVAIQSAMASVCTTNRAVPFANPHQGIATVPGVVRARARA